MSILQQGTVNDRSTTGPKVNDPILALIVRSMVDLTWDYCQTFQSQSHLRRCHAVSNYYELRGGR